MVDRLRWTTIVIALFAFAGRADAQAAPPAEVKAFDTPNDAGKGITLTWRRAESAPPGTVYEIKIAETADGPFSLAAEVDASGNLMSDEPGLFGYDVEHQNFHVFHVREYAVPTEPPSKRELENDKTYFFRVGVPGEAGKESGVVQAEARGNLFNWAKLNNLILGGLFSIAILVYIRLARRKDFKIRRLAGLDALDEALGRATEMGKPVFFIHGLTDMGSPSTIASVNILGQVARRTARYETQLKVGNRDPIVMSVSQEVVKEACIEVGRPDAFNEDDIFLAAADQFSYAAALEGMMTREKPAANLLMGYFYAEALLLAETGSATGAIQIAATDAYTQLPFFVTTCDYTLMGEELYAASAYLSRDPKLLGSLKGQDLGKGIFILVILLGTLLSTAGYPLLTRILTSY